MLVLPLEEHWQVVQQPTSPRLSSDGGRETVSSKTVISATLDEKSCASSWEFVQRASSGKLSSGSPSWSGSPRRQKQSMLVTYPNSGGGGSEGQQSSNDIPGDELVGEQVGVDAPNTRNWYPQDSMEIDAMLAQELGLLVTGPELQRIQVFPTAYCQPLYTAPVDFHPYEAARPSVCQKANRMLQGFFGTQMSLPADMDFRPTEEDIVSLKTFLDEEVPKFPFSRSPDNSAVWTQLKA